MSSIYIFVYFYIFVEIQYLFLIYIFVYFLFTKAAEVKSITFVMVVGQNKTLLITWHPANKSYQSHTPAVVILVQRWRPVSGVMSCDHASTIVFSNVQKFWHLFHSVLSHAPQMFLAARQ